MEYKETLQEAVLNSVIENLQNSFRELSLVCNVRATLDDGKVSLDHPFWSDLAKSAEHLVYHAVRAGRYTTYVFGWTARQRLKGAEDYLQELYEAALVAEALK